MERDSHTPSIVRSAGTSRNPLPAIAGLSAALCRVAVLIAVCADPAPALERQITLAPDIAAHVVADDWPLDDPGVSDAVETARLRAGVLCVAWANDMIAQHWRLLDSLEGPGTWTRERQRLWLQIGWIEDFESTYLRPRIDADSQRALLDVWWPEGVGTPAGSAAAESMHGFCRGLPGVLEAVDPNSPYRLERAFH